MCSFKTNFIFLHGSVSYSAAIRRGGGYNQVCRCCFHFHVHDKLGHKKKGSPKVSYCTMMAFCTHAQLVTHSSLAMVQYISL